MSLHPSISHYFRLRALNNFLLDHDLPVNVVIGIHSMTELVHKQSMFEFSSEHFLQTSGTAIGTKMAPAYANTAMSILERNLLTGSCNKPLVWLRYIDDILAICTYGEDKLLGFLSHINSIHSCFRLTCNHYKECVQFFDVSVSVDRTGKRTTDLYAKPSDAHQYLLATSWNPSNTKPSIPNSQALRIVRICSNIETARSRCTELVDCFVKRGYNKGKTNIQIERTYSNLANPSTVRKCHTNRPMYLNVQFHHGLPYAWYLIPGNLI